jgi:hypothetical protein
MALSAVLAGCSSKPPTPEWQLNAKSASDRFVAAYLVGNARLENFEFDRARRELSSTGRLDLLARLELLRCAARVASAVFAPCEGFDPLRSDGTAEDRAYADYLRAQVPGNASLLPPSQRAVAAALQGAGEPSAQLAAVKDPLARLVAAGVLLQRGQASPAVLQQAVDAASSQGWRRPLLAWLGMQLQRAEQAPGDAAAEAAAEIRRRIAVVQGTPVLSPVYLAGPETPRLP